MTGTAGPGLLLADVPCGFHLLREYKMGPAMGSRRLYGCFVNSNSPSERKPRLKLRWSVTILPLLVRIPTVYGITCFVFASRTRPETTAVPCPGAVIPSIAPNKRLAPRKTRLPASPAAFSKKERRVKQSLFRSRPSTSPPRQESGRKGCQPWIGQPIDLLLPGPRGIGVVSAQSSSCIEVDGDGPRK